jgi:twitching motility protein PilT
MITMEDAINGLLEQGLVDKEEARRILMKTTDEGSVSEEDSDTPTVGGKKQEPVNRKAAAMGLRGQTGGVAGSSDEGYSF